VDQSFLIEKLLNIVQELHEMAGVPEEQKRQEKNILQTSASDPNKKVTPRLNTNEKARTIEIATLFAKTFYEFKKKKTPDEKPDTLIKDIQKKTTPPPLPDGGKDGKKGPNLGLMSIALLGGLGALLYGLIEGGPLMGIMKIFSRIGLTAFVALLKIKVKIFVGNMKGVLKWPLRIFGTIAKSFGEMFKGFAKAVIPGGMKAVGKGLLGSVGKFLGYFAKAFRRIPVIGSLISIGFAISRFMRGDVVGGVIDSLSALTGLLWLVPGGGFLAVPISLGLDILNAVLDVKAAKAEKDGTGQTKGDILKEMAMGLWEKMKPGLRYTPVFGTLFELGDAYNAFKGGNIVEGIKHLGMGIMKLTPLPGVVEGIGMLIGMFGGKKDEEPQIKSDGSWIGKIKEWIKSKIANLPFVLRKPLEWFGFFKSDSKETVGDDVSSSFDSYEERISGFTGGIWNSVSNFGSVVSDSFKKMTAKAGEFLKDRWNKTKENASKVGSFIGSRWNKTKENASKVGSFIGSRWNKTKEPHTTKLNTDKKVQETANISKQYLNNRGKSFTKIASKHLEYMSKLVNLNEAMYKALVTMAKNGNGGGQVIPMISPQGSQSSGNMAEFGNNRNGYATSHYAFA
jgi:hypothetical protein